MIIFSKLLEARLQSAESGAQDAVVVSLGQEAVDRLCHLLGKSFKFGIIGKPTNCCQAAGQIRELSRSWDTM